MQPSELSQNTVLNTLRTECNNLERQYLRYASGRPAFSPEFQSYILGKLLAASKRLPSNVCTACAVGGMIE